MGHIAYWIVYSTFFIIFLWMSVKKGFKFLDYIMFISMVALSQALDHMLGIACGLFYYVKFGKVMYFYAFFYDTLVYPTVALLFTKLFPRKVKLNSLVIYNLSWIMFSFLFELLIAYPFGIIIYTGWRVFPYSLLFYCGIFPILTWYKLLLEKKLDHEQNKRAG